MPHANDGSMHQYRPRSAGILFIPEELIFDPAAATTPEQDDLFDQLVKAMSEPLMERPVVPTVIRCSPEEFERLWACRIA